MLFQSYFRLGFVNSHYITFFIRVQLLSSHTLASLFLFFTFQSFYLQTKSTLPKTGKRKSKRKRKKKTNMMLMTALTKTPPLARRWIPCVPTATLKSTLKRMMRMMKTLMLMSLLVAMTYLGVFPPFILRTLTPKITSTLQVTPLRPAQVCPRLNCPERPLTLIMESSR